MYSLFILYIFSNLIKYFFFNFILPFLFKLIHSCFFYAFFNDELFFDIYYENNEFHSDLNTNGLFMMWTADIMIWLIRFFFFGF